MGIMRPAHAYHGMTHHRHEARSMTTAAIIATTRFGFAARGRDLGAVAGDPRGWVLGQLAHRPAQLPASLPSSASMVAAMLQARQDKKAGEQTGAKDELRAVFFAEIGARMNAAIASENPLLERLVFFWSNHFTVSAMRPVVRGFVGAFEREAIRPHVTGRFADMLLAVARHPGMGFYLDNVQSIGPISLIGRRAGKGLNENLGREILELHTLGVDGGYSQKDVEALARILTGWTIARLRDPDPGSFRFVPQIHEPGPKMLLGRSYAESGAGEVEPALRDLAGPTPPHRDIAFNLARHFIP